MLCRNPLHGVWGKGRIPPMDINTAYQEALDYLYSFVDFSLTHQENLAPENFNLARMHALVASLGNPHQAYPTIHVAGTKGKGSVSLLCAAALQEQGYRVGLYTSPHLKDFEERIQINRVPISQADFVALIGAIKSHVENVPQLSTFEIATALAFWYFARQQVDIAVIEVGLGGRLDATNVVTPLVSVITSLSLEHTYVLGDTLEEIAAEKAGIIKEGVPVVVAPQQAGPRRVISQIAERRHAPLVQMGHDYQFVPRTFSLQGQTFSIWRANQQEQTATELEILLLGAHQVENAATAYVALQVARRAGLAIEETAIRQGFARAIWPGRFEVLRQHPPVVIDSAHNPYSARALKQALEDYYPDWPVVLLLGVLGDKDIEGILQELLPRVASVITSDSAHPRAMDPERLAELVAQYDCPVKAVPHMADALDYALQMAGEDHLVLATGSIFTAASARIAWQENHT